MKWVFPYQNNPILEGGYSENDIVAFPLNVYPLIFKEFFEILGIHDSHIDLVQWIDRGYRQG